MESPGWGKACPVTRSQQCFRDTHGGEEEVAGGNKNENKKGVREKVEHTGEIRQSATALVDE